MVIGDGVAVGGVIDGQLIIGRRECSICLLEVEGRFPCTDRTGLYFDNHIRSVCFFAIELLSTNYV